ncbi:HIT family protein [Rossellomorea marisflavi]|uniref:HIT family protein n=1 Tax=Rossellomorea marisflavi TaxID=189381 RepID=UPI0011E77443|nr:HIT family protein [Rossellomorea marisflavi]TYO68901.1 HIT family protein [Rossellomorea marisflavi]
MNCIGCRLAKKQENVHVVYETATLTCILDYMPFNPGHVLILPKQHATEVEELDPRIAIDIMEASRFLSKVVKAAFNPDGITIIQNGGGFNDLDHYHMHVIPRFEGQDFAEFFSEEGEPAQEEDLAQAAQKLIRVIKEMERHARV